MRDKPLELSEIRKLAFAFEESDLPFKVDIVDYNMVADEFKKRIDQDKVPFDYSSHSHLN